MSHAEQKRNVLLLAASQAFAQTASVLVMTLSGLVGLSLAANKNLSTLPVAMMMVASTATMIPASLFMQRYGRKRGFLLGTLFAWVAGLLGAAAI